MPRGVPRAPSAPQAPHNDTAGRCARVDTPPERARTTWRAWCLCMGEAGKAVVVDEDEPSM